MPIVESVFVPSRSRTEGLGGSAPARGWRGGLRAGAAPRGRRRARAPGMLRAMPEPPARSRRCSARGALKRRSAAPGDSGSIPVPTPRTRRAEPRQPPEGGSGSRGLAFPPVGSGRGFLSPRGRKSSRGCGARSRAPGTAGPGLGAPRGAPVRPGASLRLERERHAQATRLTAAASLPRRDRLLSAPAHFYVCVCLLACCLK